MKQISLSEIYTNPTLNGLEELNFYNLVHHMRDELIKIHRGKNAVKVIPSGGFMRNLEEQGILVCYHRGGGKNIKISDRVLRIMEEEEWV